MSPSTPSYSPSPSFTTSPVSSPSFRRVNAIDGRVSHFQEVIYGKNIDMKVLAELATSGIPDSPGLRSVYWKVLLGYLPPSRSEWTRSLAQMRGLFRDWVSEFMIDPRKAEEMKREKGMSDHPLSTAQDSSWNLFFKDSEMMSEIDKDIRRTFPNLNFFQQPVAASIAADGSSSASPSSYSTAGRGAHGADIKYTTTHHYDSMRRILFIYAKLNPGLAYVQGMNEILAPIYYIFANDPNPDFAENAEADAFHCFRIVMSEIMDNFIKTLDKSDVGVTAAVKRGNMLLRRHDYVLWANLEEKQLNPQFYSFRWISLLLAQEFELPEVLRLWDAFFADERRFDLLFYVCCSMLCYQRDVLLAGTFADNLKLLQRYPPVDIQQLLTLAEQLRGGKVFTVPPPKPSSLLFDRNGNLVNGNTAKDVPDVNGVDSVFQKVLDIATDTSDRLSTANPMSLE